jgi:hypothetical protein
VCVCACVCVCVCVHLQLRACCHGCGLVVVVGWRLKPPQRPCVWKRIKAMILFAVGGGAELVRYKWIVQQWLESLSVMSTLTWRTDFIIRTARSVCTVDDLSPIHAQCIRLWPALLTDPNSVKN